MNGKRINEIVLFALSSLLCTLYSILYTLYSKH